MAEEEGRGRGCGMVNVLENPVRVSPSTMVSCRKSPHPPYNAPLIGSGQVGTLELLPPPYWVLTLTHLFVEVEEVVGERGGDRARRRETGGDDEESRGRVGRPISGQTER